MTNDPIRVLLIEDDPDDVLLLKETLAETDALKIKLTCSDRLSNGLKRIAEQEFDILLLDLNLPDSLGLETLKSIIKKFPLIPIVVLSGLADDFTTFEAIKQGAQDFLIKGKISSQVLARVIRYAIERKQVDQALQESEIKYRSLVESAPDIIYSFSNKRGGIFYNSQVKAVLGYSADELYSDPFLWNRSIHPDDQARVAKAIAEFTQGKKFNVEYRIHDRDGNWLWLLDRSVRRRMAGDEIIIDGLATNITERKQVEQELKDSEKRFQDIADNAQEWIWEVDATGKHTYASQIVEKILGYTPEEILQKHFWDLFHPEDREALKAAALTIFTKKQPFRDFINRNVHKNGQTIWLSTSALPLLDGKGNLLGYRGADTDITEHKQSEITLQESEKRYHDLFENSPISLWEEDFSEVKQRLDALRAGGVIDMRAYLGSHPKKVVEFASLIKVLDVNITAVERCKAKDKDDLIKNLSKILIPQSDLLFRQELEAIADGKTKFNAEGINQTLTGEPVEINITWSVMSGHESDMSKVLISAVDITERKQAEEEWRKIDELYRTLVDTSPYAVMLDDLENRISFTNKQAALMHGYAQPEDMIGMSAFDLIAPEDRARMAENTQKTLEEGNIHNLEYTLLRKDGSRFDAELSTAVIKDAQGEPAAFVGITHDITEKKKAVQELQESEERFSSAFNNAAVGMSLASPDGHFIKVNRALCAIVGYSEEELLSKTFHEITYPDDLEADLALINQALSGDIESFQMEKRYIHKLGHLVWAQLNVSLVRDEKGKPLNFVAQIQDISERKRADAIREITYKIADFAITTSKIDENFGQIHEIIRGVIPAENFYIALYNSEDNLISFPYFVDQFDPLPEPHNLYRGLTAYLLCTGKPLHATREVVDEIVKQGEVEQMGTHPIDWLGVPLQIDEKVVGAMVTQSYTESIRFSDDDLNLLNIIATQIVTVIQRKQAVRTLQHRLEYEKLIANISNLFVTLSGEQFDRKINQTLQAIGEFAGADYSYIQLFSEDGTSISSTHEWCAEGIEPQINNFQEIPIETIPWWTAQIKQMNTINIARLADLPPEASAEKELLQAVGIQSVLATPMAYNSFGFLGFDSVRAEKVWTEETITLLRVVGEIIGGAIIREKALTDYRKSQDDLKNTVNQLEMHLTGAINVMAMVVEKRDPYTAGHQARVAKLASAIGGELGFSAERIQALNISALVHDIGKITIPAEILSKPSKLTTEEFSLILSHPASGYEIVKNINFPGSVAEIIYQYHERMNGSGYPRGLKGEEILLEARILCVADVVEAMSSHRPYRPALGIEKALEEISKNKEILYDPEVVDACLNIFKKGEFGF